MNLEVGSTARCITCQIKSAQCGNHGCRRCPICRSVALAHWMHSTVSTTTGVQPAVNHRAMLTCNLDVTQVRAVGEQRVDDRHGTGQC